jgi:aminopeptidase
MSLEEYQEFLYTACAVQDAEVDPVAYWVNVQEAQQRVIEGLAGHAEVTVRSENCDLKLSIEGRKFVNACGRHNMPDGEIYTSPVEDSVNGWIRFTYPAVYRGTEVAGVELQFEAGRVVKAKAEKNQAFLDKMLETDQGSRYLGEFALGTNQGVQRFTRNILFDEKIGGSIHLALGAGYPETGSKNQSAIHWDMICDVRQNAEIRVDGELFYQDGKFVI